MQRELSSRRMKKPQTPFVMQNYITREKQEKTPAGSKSDHTDQPIGSKYINTAGFSCTLFVLTEHEVLAAFREEPSSEVSWWGHLLRII